MFFALSKILGFLLNPLVWIMSLLLVGIFNKNSRSRQRCVIVATILFYIFSNDMTYGIISHQWDYKSITFEDISEPYDLGIVLTGYTTLDSDLANYQYFHHFGQNANRLTQSLELYKWGKIKKIMISGGSGDLTGEKISEGAKTKEFLLRMGVPERDILIEPQSRNTIENARSSKVFLDQHSEKYNSILLLTSAFHMRRSKMCFDGVGLVTTPFSLGNVSNSYNFHISHLLPNPAVLLEWYKLEREWAAIVVYYMLGYI